MTKNRPPVESFSYDLFCLPVGSTIAVEDDALQDELMIPPPTDEGEEDEIFEGEDEEVLRYIAASAQKREGKVTGATIVGDYSTYVELMEKKFSKRGTRIDGQSSPLVIDSIDGAEHQRSKNKVTSVISFSSSIICPKLLKAGLVTAGSSKNILTWKQARGTESLSSMTPLFNSYFESKKAIKNEAHGDQNVPDRSNYFYYELHDGKMLYLMTQHGQYSRKNCPFLLCSCEKGEGVMNDDWVCKRINDEEQLRLFSRSQRRWDRMTSKVPSVQWGYKEHMDWASVFNKGNSHFGVSPALLPRSSIRFDTFHMKCALTRNLMSYLQKFLLNQPGGIQENFKLILKTFWNEYHLYCWENKKSFASFQGNELALFVANESNIKLFLEQHLVMTARLRDILSSLKIFKDIFKFLGIARLCADDDVDAIAKKTHVSVSAYKDMMLKFKDNVKKFYNIGSRTFLSRRGDQGKDETFYMHTLRYYMPSIVETTFERHGVGVGVFNMQGFERRNKESKNIYNKYNNHHGQLITNINRLWDIFEHDVVAV